MGPLLVLVIALRPIPVAACYPLAWALPVTAEKGALTAGGGVGSRPLIRLLIRTWGSARIREFAIPVN